MTDWENKASIAVGACENMDEVRTLIAGLMESTEILDWLQAHVCKINGSWDLIDVNSIGWQKIPLGEIIHTKGSSLRDCVIKAMEEENE